MRTCLVIYISLLGNLAWSQAPYPQIDDLINDYEKDDLFNGIILIAEEGEITYFRSVGYANFTDRIKLTANTPMPLSSNTKPFTTMAVMILKERGLLDYDDKITTYLNNFPYQNMSVRHLMTSTSGLKRLYNKAAHGDELVSIQELMDFLVAKEPKLAFPPGDNYLSSVAGFSVLARITEEIVAKPFGLFIEEEIFQPLQMENTFLLTKETWQLPRATSYDRKNQEEEWFLGSYSGGIGIYSSAADLLKWDQALRTEKLVPRAAMTEAYTSVVLNDGSEFNNGFGWRKWKGKENLIFKNGTWVANNSILFRDLEKNRTVILLANRQNEVSNWELIEIVLGQLGY